MRAVLFGVLAIALGTGAAVATLEVGLRLNAYRPWQHTTESSGPIMFEASRTLGWEPKPGTYTMAAYDWSGPVQVTIRSDRARDSGAAVVQSPGLVLLGCSFTFGWAVSDNDTFAARLQQRHPDWEVMNLGVPGYGTYQSLLRLEELLARGTKPARVVYAYMQGHEQRNVADPMWALKLKEHSRQGMAAVPFATLDHDGTLVRHAAERYPTLPLRNHLALVSYLEMRFAGLTRRDRITQRDEISDRIILDMAKLCRDNGIDFAMVLLLAQPGWKDHYARLLGSRDIRLIDCDMTLSPRLTVANDGHPNATAHGMYADCIEQGLTAPPRS